MILYAFSLIGCNSSSKNPYVEVITGNDTTMIDSTFVARIYLRNFEIGDVHPVAFTFDLDNSKLHMPYEEGSWIYRASHSSEGTKVFVGFIEYDSAGYNRIIPFEFRYLVID